MKKISIVVPVYYNEQSLAPLFAELLKAERVLIEKGVEMELIFVDDGSRDASLSELLKIKGQKQDVKIIKLTRNFGSVRASKTGFKFVTGDCFLILAADLQDPPELIPQMVDKWLAGSKFVICARTNRDDPLGTRIAAYIYYKLLTLFVVKDYPRGGFDLALMDRAMLPYMQSSAKNINTPLFAYWLGFKPEVIFYKRQKRIHGKSRWNFSKKLKFFIDSILGFSVVPIRLISLLGLIVSIVSFVYGVVVIVSAIRGKIPVQGFPTLAALISFLLGLVLLTLGIIGEYLWRIFDEINKSPETVIDEIF
ncbi:MAG TPA: glycosyltransferase family 2 protein [Blastocatellia bacterium]|nr:glycosyltransferase family 2 protein [Blastocatellia bacterium]